MLEEQICEEFGVNMLNKTCNVFVHYSIYSGALESVMSWDCLLIKEGGN
jgi:hypothetical protein